MSQERNHYSSRLLLIATSVKSQPNVTLVSLAFRRSVVSLSYSVNRINQSTVDSLLI